MRFLSTAKLYSEYSVLLVCNMLVIRLSSLSGICFLRSIFVVRGFQTIPQRQEDYVTTHIPDWFIYQQKSHPSHGTLLSTLWSQAGSQDEIPNKRSKEAILREEAQVLLEKAVTLRKQLPERGIESLSTGEVEQRTSKWNVPLRGDDSSNGATGYRLYVDIGREDGTWMDPRWGASQRRIEFTIDVQFQRDTNVTKQQQQCMIPDNFGGTSSPTYNLRIAPYARLRGGFDDMKCHVDNGAYRIDGQKDNRTIRLYISTDGKNHNSYGDINVPTGELYFSLPCFGNDDPNAVKNLSRKDGVVSIRQIGWHTGWRRMESRIVGTFRATPIDTAKQRDGF